VAENSDCGRERQSRAPSQLCAHPISRRCPRATARSALLAHRGVTPTNHCLARNWARAAPMMPSPGERSLAVKQPRVSSQAVISAWLSTWDRLRSLFHLLTGASEPSHQAEPPAAGRHSCSLSTEPKQAPSLPSCPGIVFAVSNSFSVLPGHKGVVELGQLCGFESSAPTRENTDSLEPVSLCRLALTDGEA
jgi:hypothetical protein